MGTYGSTYLIKNYVDTMCIQTNQTAEATAFYKFWLVFAVNGGLSVFWKDPGLAKIFRNPNANKRATPTATLASWVLRDIFHVTGAAVLPDYLEQLRAICLSFFRVVVAFFFAHQHFCCARIYSTIMCACVF